jgi:hypothetical protein
MKTSTPQIEHLKQMLSLEEKRADLQEELDAIVSKLANLQSRFGTGKPAAAAPASRAPKAPAAPKAAAVKTGRRKKRAGRGELKDNIFGLLGKAGGTGAKVTEIASALGTAPANIYAWFTAALKRYPEIKKVGAGTYSISGSASAASPKVKGKPGPKPKAKGAKPAKAAKEAKAPKGKPGRPRKVKATGSAGGSRRGELRDKILSQLKSAGSGGITIKELSSKIGANYRNLQVWFATTAKNIPGIKKLAPATYRLS